MEPIKTILEKTPLYITGGIFQELEKAELKHEWRPDMSLFEKVAILHEESGEVAKAALESDHNNLKIELMQTAAVCIRILKSLK